MKKRIVVVLLALVVSGVAQAQRYFPDGITLSNEFVRKQGLVNVSAWDNGAVTGALTRSLGVSVGQLCGINPTNGEVIVDTNNLLPLVVRSVSGDGSGLTGLNPTNLMEGKITVSNIVFSQPRWIDMLVSGTAVGRPSSGAPSLQNVGDGIQGMGYGVGDSSYFSIQGPHKFANTNANLPNFYYAPHIHVSTIAAPASNASNATFTLTYQVAAVGESFTNLISLTNSVGFSSTNTHRILGFGDVTNNLLAGKSSVIFRGVLSRISTPVPLTNDIGSGQVVIVDSLDFHVPITEVGSAAQNGD